MGGLQCFFWRFWLLLVRGLPATIALALSLGGSELKELRVLLQELDIDAFRRRLQYLPTAF